MTVLVPAALTGAAIQTAIDMLQARTDPDPYGSRPTVQLKRETYVLDAPLNIAATDWTNLAIIGAGSHATKLVGSKAFPANAPFINIVVSEGANSALGDFILKDFLIDCSYIEKVGDNDVVVPIADASGIKISSTVDNGSFTANVVENVAIFNAKYGVQIFSARCVNFERCGIWQSNLNSAVGIFIQGDQNGNASEINFNACNIDCNATGGSRGVVLNAVGPVAAKKGQLKGIGFTNTVFNHATGFVDIVAKEGGAVGDVWFNPRCQFDGTDESTHAGRGFDVLSTDASSIVDNINIAGVYFRGLWDGQPTIKMTAANGGKIYAPSIIDNWVGNTSQAFVELNNVDGAVVSGNRIYAVGGGGGAGLDHYIGLYSCRNFTCTGNVATQVGRVTYWGVQIDASCDNFTVVGNVFYGAVGIGNVNNVAGYASTRVGSNLNA